MNYMRTRWVMPQSHIVEDIEDFDDAEEPLPQLPPEPMDISKEEAAKIEYWLHTPTEELEDSVEDVVPVPRDPWLERLLACKSIYIRDRKIEDERVLFRVAWRKGDWRWIPMDQMTKFLPTLMAWQ